MARHYFRPEIQLENGELPAYAWPGGYPVYYLTADNGVLCPACANGRNGSDAARADLDPKCPDDDQWRITAYDINYEDPDCYCEHCNGRIESAYAEQE